MLETNHPVAHANVLENPIYGEMKTNISHKIQNNKVLNPPKIENLRIVPRGTTR
jgi:hypothetical protein